MVVLISSEAQGWQVFAVSEKNGFFHGKNQTGKNSFCRQKFSMYVNE